MLNKTELSAKQENVVRAARKFFGKRKVVSRTELIGFMNETFGKHSSPGFITKNTAFKAVDTNTGEVLRGMYALPAVAAKPLSMTKDAIRKRELSASKKNTGVGAGTGTPRVRKAKVVVDAPLVAVDASTVESTL